MHSFVTSKNAQWSRLIWPTLYDHMRVFSLKKYLNRIKLSVNKITVAIIPFHVLKEINK